MWVKNGLSWGWFGGEGKENGEDAKKNMLFSGDARDTRSLFQGHPKTTAKAAVCIS